MAGDLSKAPCRGATALFYDDARRAEAVSICEACPVRRPCAVYTIGHESEVLPEERFGIAAGMTPEQRTSLMRRKTLRCKCGEVRDPIQLRDGLVACTRCKTSEQTPPIPEQGDRWAKRHTTLARKIMVWMTEHSLVEGDELPSAAALARELGATQHDTIRVYHGLHAEGTLSRQGTLYRRTARTGASYYETYPN